MLMSYLKRLESQHTFKPDVTIHEDLSSFSFNEGHETLKSGESIHWLRSQTESKQTVLFLHGNSRNVTSFAAYYRLFRDLEVSFITFDYPGFGQSTGFPSEDGLYSSAQAIYDKLLSEGINQQNICIYGLSLGGAVAIELATKNRPESLIVEGTFTCTWDMAKTLPIAGKLQLYRLLKNRFNSISKISDIDCRLLIIHGTADEVTSITHGRNIFERAKEPKQFLAVEGARHGDVLNVGGERLRDAIGTFISSCPKKALSPEPVGS